MNNLDLNIFLVTANRVVVAPSMPEPTTRAEVFEQVDLRGIHGREELIKLIENCQPLAAHFRYLSMVFLDEHSRANEFFDNLVTQSGPRSDAKQQILKVLRRDPDGGWREWIRCSGDAALEGFLQRVRDWLTDGIDWSESDFFDIVWNGQAAALHISSTCRHRSARPLVSGSSIAICQDRPTVLPSCTKASMRPIKSQSCWTSSSDLRLP